MLSALKKSMERNNEWMVSQSRDSSQNINYTYKIGIYGWKKRLLYMFILLLMIMVIINLALTLWIIKVMDFSLDGMGKLHILAKGLRLEGEAQFVNPLSAVNIKSSPAKSLTVESAGHITLNSRNANGSIATRLVLGDHDMQTFADQFTVKNKRGKTLFHASDDRIEIATEMLKVTQPGGANFEGAVQTKLVTSEYLSGLHLESSTRDISLTSPKTIRMDSRGGDIFASVLDDVKLTAKNGTLMFLSNEIYMTGLPEVNMSPVMHEHEVEQLCVCGSGKLFLSPATRPCYASKKFCESPFILKT